jgi:deoxycytidine triphosphate deaminase
MRDKDTIRVWNKQTNEWVTFVAKRFEDDWVLSVQGPVRFILDLIIVSPAREGDLGELISDTGIELKYSRSENEFDNQNAGYIVCPGEMEEPFVEWVEQYAREGQLVIDDDKRVSRRLSAHVEGTN